MGAKSECHQEESEVCAPVWKNVCHDEPKEVCNKVQKQVCHPLAEECRDVDVPLPKGCHKPCKKIPKKVCGINKKQKCVKVPEEVCSSKTKRVCWPVPTKVCEPVQVKKPRKVCVHEMKWRSLNTNELKT